MRAPALLLTLAVIAGCAPAAAPAPGPRPAGTVTIEDPRGTVGSLPLEPAAARYQGAGVARPLAEAWAALPAAYEALALHGGAPAGGHRFSVPRLRATRALGGVRLSRYLDCGSSVGMANADHYAVTLHVATRLSETTPSATLAETLVQASAKPIGTAGETVPCTSTGELERAIAARLRG